MDRIHKHQYWVKKIQTQRPYDSVYITFKKRKTNLCVRNQFTGYPWSEHIYHKANYTTNIWVYSTLFYWLVWWSGERFIGRLKSGRFKVYWVLPHEPRITLDDRSTRWVRISAHWEVMGQWPGSHSTEGLLFTARCSFCIMVSTHQSKNLHSKSQRYLLILPGQGESPGWKT